MTTLLLGLCVLVGIGYVAFWFIDHGLPAPLATIARILVVLTALIALYYLAQPVFGLH